jgi:Kef-type K+ transport system membrane component KefB
MKARQIRILRPLVLYSALVGLPAYGVLKVLGAGQQLSGLAGRPANLLVATETMTMPNLSRLLAQMIVILAVARLIGRLFRKIHQPQVIGEMVAGILLGPSLFGSLLPQLSGLLFPPSSLGYLNSLSQVSVVLYMFLVGLGLDTQELRRHRQVAFIISHASIICPFLLGTVLALYLYPRLSEGGTTFMQFSLFLGTAMSVTAFPVLARIVTDRNLAQTKVGIVAIASAAVDDVTAWCMLAAVVLLVKAEHAPVPVWMMLAGCAAYVLAMLFGVRPALHGLAGKCDLRGAVTSDVLAVVILLALASGWTTELLGIHALFGAFLMGVVMPKGSQFVGSLVDKLEPVTTVVLLPLFFAFTGLRTSVGLLATPMMWFYCALIVMVAVAGKFGASLMSTRLSGMSWRESSAVGTLMNTRGLMELVVLNIGLDVGAISRTVFTMMVLMALVTTFMASPLLEWCYPERVHSTRIIVPAAAESL